MPRRLSRYGGYFTVLVIILFWGCSVEQTHKTLTYFFDGVDKTIFYNTYLSTDSLSKDAIARREGLLKKVRPDLCVHKPFREKLCEKCHTPDKRLLMPMPALCYQCHKNFQETYANVHGPVASGNCTKCHNQHSSKYDKLLTRQGQQVCTFCHAPAMVFAKKVHRDIEDAACTLCHNPHGGNNRFMVKGNISRDANRIALMSQLTSRHLYAQIFCKAPGDVNSSMEIKIYNDEGVLVSTSRPDNNGKFMLTNLHPDQTYTFRFKNGMPDCKINVMDSKGTVLYVIEKKKGKYTFDKVAYEAAHESVNTANENSGYLENTQISVNADVITRKDTSINKKVTVADNIAEISNNAEKPDDKKALDTAKAPGKTEVKELPGGEPAEEKPVKNKKLVSQEKKQPGNSQDTLVAPKGKIKVKQLTGSETAEEIAARNKKAHAEQQKAGQDGKQQDTATAYKGKIKVKQLTGSEPAEEMAVRNKKSHAEQQKAEQDGKQQDTATAYKGKIAVRELPDDNTGKPIAAHGRQAGRKYEQDNITLTDLAAEIGRLYDGTNVCVLNDSADYIDIAPVNKKGRFLLFDFLGYNINMPDSSSGIVSQTIFLNDKMELIDVVNKHISNGRYVYMANSKEPAGQRYDLRLRADKENAFLFTTIYYEEGKAAISLAGIAELNKAVAYLKEHQKSTVFIAAHTDTRGSAAYNQQLSETRAKAAADYLISQGIGKSRISDKGYGKTRPLVLYVPAASLEAAFEKNRRVEVYIKNR